LRELRQRQSLRRSAPVEARRSSLATLGVDEVVYRGLAALSIDARAALVASAVEQFDPIDVETILDAAPAAARHAVAEARNRYLRATTGPEPADESDLPLDAATGALARRVEEVANRAFATNESRR
jgi:hypothetical protein